MSRKVSEKVELLEKELDELSNITDYMIFIEAHLSVTAKYIREIREIATKDLKIKGD